MFVFLKIRFLYESLSTRTWQSSVPSSIPACDFLRLAFQGPVVQSVVSLTSSLRVISLTVLADSIHNILIFFAEKM